MLSFPVQIHQQPVDVRCVSIAETIDLTIIVKAAPLFATILCRWLGRLAMPIGEADSIVAGAIVFVMVRERRGEVLVEDKDID